MSRWKYITIIALAILCVACKISFNDREDDEPRLPENPTENPSNPSSTVKVVEQTIAKDTVVKAEDVTEVTLTYSAAITIEHPEHITLNDRVATGASATENTLTIPLSLEPASRYTLIVKSDALSAGENKAIASFTLNFATRATVNIGNVATTLCTSDPAKEAVSLYSQLHSVYGKNSISGVTENSISENKFSVVIKSITEKSPAIINYDFKDIHISDYSNMSAITAHHDAGGIVAFSWNWCVPSSKDSSPSEYSVDNNFSLVNALIKGKWEYDFIENDLDIVATHLQALKDVGIPVLFDPVRAVQNHWWGKKGGAYFRELWKLVYDRLVVKHGLNNLIWVWTAESDNITTEELKEWYPGDNYCDIIGTPIYADGIDSQIERFLFINEAFEGRKMIAITECGNILDIEACHSAGDTWLYFTINSADNNYNYYQYNTESHWNKTLNSPFVVTLP